MCAVGLNCYIKSTDRHLYSAEIRLLSLVFDAALPLPSAAVLCGTSRGRNRLSGMLIFLPQQ